MILDFVAYANSNKYSGKFRTQLQICTSASETLNGSKLRMQIRSKNSLE